VAQCMPVNPELTDECTAVSLSYSLTALVLALALGQFPLDDAGI
jgi:hypothetical protein